MSKKNAETSSEKRRLFQRKLRYRGRAAQILIYLGKFLRMFIYQSDWKVFPISALISGLLAYVIRSDFLRTMEGTLKGSFALACVALWNGCFNSIQVICREREVIKREHRSGMHISSYIAAHMIYQAMLCLGQTILMLYVFALVRINFQGEGLITRWFRLDLGITIFLITYAADMLALLISAIVHNTTDAMTVMPFILIFQLIFSGGIFSLPSWSKPLTNLTITSHGLSCLAAQADYNNLPMASGWNTLWKMRDTRIEGTVTMNDLLGILSEENAADNEMIRTFRQMSVSELMQEKETSTENRVAGGSAEEWFLDEQIAVGDVLDLMAESRQLETVRNKEFAGSVTVGQIIELFGEDKVKKTIMEQSSRASRNAVYENTPPNILGCWYTLGFYALLYAFAAMISLEFVDKDKR